MTTDLSKLLGFISKAELDEDIKDFLKEGIVAISAGQTDHQIFTLIENHSEEGDSSSED